MALDYETFIPPTYMGGGGGGGGGGKRRGHSKSKSPKSRPKPKEEPNIPDLRKIGELDPINPLWLPPQRDNHPLGPH